MKEIVVLSGKGGTGKTSLTASFAILEKGNIVVADCDVDAADLHLLLTPKINETHDFSGGKKAFIQKDKCISCGKCIEACRFDAISDDYVVDPIGCEGCKFCVYVCPVGAIDFNKNISGQYFLSDSRVGPMVHAKLGVAEENSGKLVTYIKAKGENITRQNNKDYFLVDASPGVGCAIIASITGADIAVIVTEPTLSGLHDFERVLKLTKQFRIKSLLIINKYDLNLKMATSIENFAKSNGVKVIGKIPYDDDFYESQVEGKAAVEYSDKLKSMINVIWEKVKENL
ncbi:4Fe-4S binding protein [bacterium]|nr:4Fe-4S binding protein [bacterium]